MIEDLIKIIEKYMTEEELAFVMKAYEYAKLMHKDQKRKSGEPYIIHPVNVAIILADLDMDVETIVSALLHDVVEDTPATYDDIKEMFSEDVAKIVDGVTKLNKLNYKKMCIRDRCRVIYDGGGIKEISYEAYQMRPVHSLQLVYSDDIDYTYKSTDRGNSTEASTFSCRSS